MQCKSVFLLHEETEVTLVLAAVQQLAEFVVTLHHTCSSSTELILMIIRL